MNILDAFLGCSLSFMCLSVVSMTFSSIARRNQEKMLKDTLEKMTEMRKKAFEEMHSGRPDQN